MDVANVMNAWSDDPPGQEGGTATWPALKGVDFARSHPLFMDAGIALTVGALGWASLSFGRSHFGDPAGAVPWLFTGAMAALLAARRRWPLCVFLALALLAFVQWMLGFLLAADVALLVSLYTVADERPRRVALWAGAILEFGAVLATIRWGVAGTADRSLIFLSGLVAAAFLAGTNIRARRAHVLSLIERAARLEFERDQQAQIATAAERTRIAREMHDVIAHSLAVIIALADGANAKLRRDPDQASRALCSVAETGRQALDDTRRLLGVLRTYPPAGSFRPQPGIGQIAGLVGQAAAVGLGAELRIDGEPFAVGPGPGLSAYRIVQEAITNTLKHADGATRMLVWLRYSGRNLEIDVRDDGRPTSAATAPARSGGFGLEGMRERAAIYDGTLSAGPLAGGGWEVRMTMRIAEVGVR
jgi:signal transduction histidine kinase